MHLFPFRSQALSELIPLGATRAVAHLKMSGLLLMK